MNQISHRSEYLTGTRKALPVVFGYIPIGIAYAIMAGQAGLTPAETVFMSLTVFAGASQMMAVGMIAEGASVIAIIIATFILNFRHFIMSTCIFNRATEGSVPLRTISSYFVTDESFALFTTGKEVSSSIYFYLGIGTVSYVSWVSGAILGSVASAFLPAILSASFAIALYAMFISLLTPNLVGNYRLILLVLLTALTNTILHSFLSDSWSLIFSTLICAAIGTFFIDNDNDDENEKEVRHA